MEPKRGEAMVPSPAPSGESDCRLVAPLSEDGYLRLDVARWPRTPARMLRSGRMVHVSRVLYDQPPR